MKEIIISEFKAKCIGILKGVQRTREPVIVTRRGKPIARIEPIAEGSVERRLGLLEGRMVIHGDLVGEESTEEWEMVDESSS